MRTWQRVCITSILVLFWASLGGVVPAGGALVSLRHDTLNNSDSSATSNHEVVFTVQDDIAANETLTIDFPNFSSISDIDCGDIDVASSVEFSFNSAGHLTSCFATATAWGFSVAGTTITISAPTAGGVYVATSTEITVRIGSNAVFQEQGASWITNPSSPRQYAVNVGGSFQQTPATSGVAVSIGSGVMFTATVAGIPAPTPTPTPTPPGGGGAILPPAGETSVVLEGKAYPRAFITALKDKQVTATILAKDSGIFQVKLKGVQPGIYAFGVFAQDAKGRKSLTLSFALNVIKDLTTTVSGIFIPPTIATDRALFYPDETLEAEGYTFPQSTVNIVFNSSQEVIERVQSGSDGLWSLQYPLTPLGTGDHSTRAKTHAPDGDQSDFSETRLFTIIPKGQPFPSASFVPGAQCRGADLNLDGKVNLVDFSIMLYWWQSRNAQHPCVDINKDGIVNLIDFSIMMYQWTR